MEELITEYAKNCKTSPIDLNSLKLQLQGCKSSSHLKETTKNQQEYIEDGQEENENDLIVSESITITFVCELCHLVFKDEDVLREHDKVCKINKVDNQDVTEQLKHLKPHKGKYKNNANEDFICDICDKRLSSKIRLGKHYDSHSKIKSFYCSTCGRCLTNKHRLQMHEETHKHNEYECSTCLKIYPSDIILKRHISTTHVKKHICELCGLKFTFNTALIDHMRTHTGERPYKCEMCGKDFKQRSTLRSHIRCRHTEERPFRCDTCQKTFSCKGGLNKHRVTHTTDKEVKNFACDQENCDKSFYSQIRLQMHLHRHKLPLKYKCTVCDKAFKNSEGLKRHILCHTSEKPFECHICQKGFNQNGNLKIHMKSHLRRKCGDVKSNTK